MSTCTFSSPSVTPGSGTASSVVTIATTGHTASLRRQPFSYVATFTGFLLPFGIVLFGGKARRRKSGLPFVLLVVFASLCFLNGCSGTGTSSGNTGHTGGTPAGTYNVQVIGTSASLAHSTTITLSVQ
jgi:hypothetical protein